MNCNIIVAYCKNYGIGLNNNLPWNIRSDLFKFSKLTRGNGNSAIIMGKNTWNSLPMKPLPRRDNLILSKSLDINIEKYDDKNKKNYYAKSFDKIEKIYEYCNDRNYETIWVIGGSKIYNLFLTDQLIKIDKIYVTYIDKEFESDVFFPKINTSKYKFTNQSEQYVPNLYYDFKIYDRVYQNIDQNIDQKILIKKYHAWGRFPHTR